MLYHIKNICFQGDVCSVCGQKLKDPSIVDDHVRNCGINSTYYCVNCLFVTDSTEKMAAHAETHEKEEKRQELVKKRE